MVHITSLHAICDEAGVPIDRVISLTATRSEVVFVMASVDPVGSHSFVSGEDEHSDTYTVTAKVHG